MNHVLIVDDEAAMRAALEASFRRRGWSVETAIGVDDAISKFQRSPFSLVVTDMRMLDGDGLQVMQGVRAAAPEVPVIVLTAYGSVPDAVFAIKSGACEYLQKPVSFDQLEAAANRFLFLEDSASSQQSDFTGIAASPAFQSVLARARRAACADADILIEAESGTGKELIARMIHRLSSRSAGPFVAVNCAAFPENLLESELFGHVRGAFTGALNAKPGKFELADGGTLLLDEVGEMPLALQPKLLRALQEREIDRLGDTRPLPVDVRVIATTNRFLRAQVDAGEFRADLFYRLHVIPLTIPPLRERREDILPLAEHFLRKHEPRSMSGRYSLSPELVSQLKSQLWPGNVRELENFIRRALALSNGPLLQPQPLERYGAGAGEDLGASANGGTTLQEMERSLLEKTLEATRGNRTHAARLMGVSLRTVRNKIREYGLPAWRPS